MLYYRVQTLISNNDFFDLNKTNDFKNKKPVTGEIRTTAANNLKNKSF